MAIKEAIKALVIEVIPRGKIIFGGHPAITPLIASLMADHFPDYADRAILYQSMQFEGQFPPEVASFPNVIYTPKSLAGLAGSLLTMRKRMLSDQQISAAVFVGGMEGVIDEFDLVKEICPNATLVPLASTGAAALAIFEGGNFTENLKLDITYSTIFRNVI